MCDAFDQLRLNVPRPKLTKLQRLLLKVVGVSVYPSPPFGCYMALWDFPSPSPLFPPIAFPWDPVVWPSERRESA